MRAESTKTPPSSPRENRPVPPTPFIDHTNHWDGTKWVFVKKTESHNK